MARNKNGNSRTNRLLAGVISLIGVILAGAPAARAQVDPGSGKLERAPGWRHALDASLDTWNDVYGYKVFAAGWTDLGRIADDAERDAVVATITDPGAAWFPSVDANDPPSATALQLPDDPTIRPEQIDAWRTLVDKLVRVGHRKVEITWYKDGHGSFTSLCVVSPLGIVYDTMLSNTAVGADNPDRAQCLDYRMGWAWQSEWKDMTRGHIKAHNNPTCRNGQVVACDYDCNDVSMTLGDAKINCSTQKVGNNCCQLTYSWAWVTSSFKSIKVGADDFTLEIEGSIGSGASGGGSCTVCCDGNRPGSGCAADFNADGRVDSRDFIEFLNAWSSGEQRADITGDGVIDSRDAAAFLNLWTAGCA